MNTATTTISITSRNNLDPGWVVTLGAVPTGQDGDGLGDFLKQ